MQLNFILLLILTLGMSGCATHVDYQNPNSVKTVDISFGSTDLQAMATNMVDSMLMSPALSNITAHSRPIVFVDRVTNKTSEHIDTESITDKISTDLLNSGKFLFIDVSKMDAVKNQLDYQNHSGLVDPSKAIKFGRQVGAEYMLYGNLSSIVKQDGSNKSVYYKMTMRLMDLNTGLIEWADEKQLRKQQERRLFGL
ncbi:MAG: penicillin-binding protein activator LpoB [Ferrimonas sp.]